VIKRLAILLFLFISSNAFATTVTLQYGTDSYTGSETCSVGTFDANQNDSSLLYFRDSASYTHVLMYFDLSSIPENATINSATLSVNVYEEYNSSVTNIGIGAITDPDTTGGWSCSTDKATYNEKQQTSNTLWKTGGTTNITGVDDTQDSQIDVSATGWATWTVTGLVQDWVDGTTSNAGFWIKEVDSSNARGRSNAYATVADRPKLTIEYTPSGTTFSGNIKLRNTYTDYCEDADNLLCVRMDSLIDESGNDNHVTNNGATAVTSGSSIDSSIYYDFDGDNDYMEIIDNGSLDFGDEDFTLCGWVMSQDWTSDSYTGRVIQKGNNSTGGIRWLLNTSTTSWNWEIQIDDNSTQSQGYAEDNYPDDLNTDQWYLVCGTRNTSTNKLKMWIDGVDVTKASDTDDNTGSLAGQNGRNIIIGDRCTLAGGCPSGDASSGLNISGVFVWGRVLTSTEMLDIYSGGVR